MFVNFDEPVEAPVKEVSSEPEFNKNLFFLNTSGEFYSISYLNKKINA